MRSPCPAADVAQWRVSGLAAGRLYAYEVAAETPLYAGGARTARAPGGAFSFALIADTHIVPREPLPPGTAPGADGWGEVEARMTRVVERAVARSPDFVVHLGDVLDFHDAGFNRPPPSAHWSRAAYRNYRRLLGPRSGDTAFFHVLGNWDGELGCFSADEIARSRSQRLAYLPGPGAETTPEGGSVHQDYSAVTWGDALLVFLNPMTYTPTCHAAPEDAGTADDWTLGAAQLAWLEETLAGSTARWRFLFLHHTVGGNGGNPVDSKYGRGGGRAAGVGEQAAAHALMQQHGVRALFYGHDHVFTDMVVDGIHYTLPGSAGAPWRFTPRETGYEEYWPDPGFGLVEVTPDHVSVSLISVEGAVLHAYRLAPTGADTAPVAP